jgi:hypothetical protein
MRTGKIAAQLFRRIGSLRNVYLSIPYGTNKIVLHLIWRTDNLLGHRNRQVISVLSLLNNASCNLPFTVHGVLSYCTGGCSHNPIRRAEPEFCYCPLPLIERIRISLTLLPPRSLFPHPHNTLLSYSLDGMDRSSSATGSVVQQTGIGLSRSCLTCAKAKSKCLPQEGAKGACQR